MKNPYPTGKELYGGWIAAWRSISFTYRWWCLKETFSKGKRPFYRWMRFKEAFVKT